ncbi:hypothetical protein D3C86_1913890 [compost metagenome]
MLALAGAHLRRSDLDVCLVDGALQAGDVGVDLLHFQRLKRFVLALLDFVQLLAVLILEVGKSLVQLFHQRLDFAGRASIGAHSYQPARYAGIRFHLHV